MPEVHSSRIKHLNERQRVSGDYVLYWMQQSQRAAGNHALEYAIQEANHLELPVVVCFGLTDTYPEANTRHVAFMLEGLKETAGTLRERGITPVFRLGDPAHVALELGRRAALIVCDRGYLRHQKAWRKQVAQDAPCLVVQIETDVIVPVEQVSKKREYAARTIRPRISRQLESYLKPLSPENPRNQADASFERGIDLSDVEPILKRMKILSDVPPVSSYFYGGTSRAMQLFGRFLDRHLEYYEEHSNKPETNDVSYMSPYLHFGQISPLYLALEVRNTADVPEEAKAVYLEELIVRRELAINFVENEPAYDEFSCLPNWAKETLESHLGDPRPETYSEAKLEAAETHDPYWNAAMNEMKYTGFMHNYMRMYWGKKILEWSTTPEEAFATTLKLNNKYFLDGRDANSYTGVAWIFGLHDRAWSRRPIFGTVRYMAASGLERKCDIQGYVRKVNRFIGNTKGGSTHA
jgi:deoxyribodipyrimidine photo-lyase